MNRSTVGSKRAEAARRDGCDHAAAAIRPSGAAERRALASLRRLWTAQTIAHSALALARPRRSSWRNPRACLDLTEDGFDHLLAQAVAAASGAALEPCRHGGDAGAATLC